MRILSTFAFFCILFGLCLILVIVGISQPVAPPCFHSCDKKPGYFYSIPLSFVSYTELYSVTPDGLTEQDLFFRELLLKRNEKILQHSNELFSVEYIEPVSSQQKEYSEP